MEKETTKEVEKLGKGNKGWGVGCAGTASEPGLVTGESQGVRGVESKGRDGFFRSPSIDAYLLQAGAADGSYAIVSKIFLSCVETELSVGEGVRDIHRRRYWLLIGGRV